MTRLLEVCTDCLADATERLAHEIVVLSAIWTRPDVVVVRSDGTQATWHEPMRLPNEAGSHGLISLN